MGIFEPHFYVTGDKFGQWTEVLSYQVNENFSPGEVLSYGEYYPRVGTIRPRLMYFIAEYYDEYPLISFPAEEWQECPEMWFAYMVRENGLPPNISVMGFATDHFRPGLLVSAREAAEVGVSPSQQIAAIQWGYQDPRMHQIFVHPEWRRRRIAGAMIGAADLINLSGNFSPGKLLYGGDVTTDGGEHLREAWGKSPRVVPRQGIISGGERGI